MTQFNLNSEVVERLFAMCAFSVPDDPIVLFGLRGCLPIALSDYEESQSKALTEQRPDYVHPACTIGIWKPGSSVLSCFAGSTVPRRQYLLDAQHGAGKANQVSFSLLQYEQGVHTSPPAGPAHRAFTQAGPFQVQRTHYDLEFSADDPFEVGQVHDNLHCARTQGVNQPYDFSSAGCQVVLGNTAFIGDAMSKDSGAWPAFRDRAYASGQDRYAYGLFDGREALMVATRPSGGVPMKLRFGSSGEVVRELQQRLHVIGETGFGEKTAIAVGKYQADQGLRPDRVVGTDTAALMNWNPWPTV
jgi:Putative peptidoglycan binding domain